MIGIAALLHKTKDAVKRRELEKSLTKRKMHKNVEFSRLRQTQNTCLGFQVTTRPLLFFGSVIKDKQTSEQERSTSWDDSTCGLFLSSHLATAQISILNPLPQTYRMYPAEYCNYNRQLWRSP